jgi:hypothetical protein
MTDGLELCCLGRLTARIEADRITGGDLAFLYASERFLAYRAWPAYAHACADNAAAVLLLMRRDTSRAKLAIFHADNWRSARAIVAAEAMLALIRQAEASHGDV